MKNALLIAALTISGSALCAPNYKSPGGDFIRPGTGLKSVAIVNAQDELPAKDVELTAKLIDETSDINVRVVTSKTTDPVELLKTSGSDIVLIVKKEANAPVLLIAPEDRWGVVNLAKIVEDLPAERAKKKFFPSRARKLIIKGFSLLCGGGSSQFPHNIMNTATVRELDNVKEQIPMDMVSFYAEYLGRLGFKPKEYVPYELACAQGWAPQPTNDAQKAIWDRVHQLPTNPIKIEFDPKRDAGK